MVELLYCMKCDFGKSSDDDQSGHCIIYSVTYKSE